MIGLLAQIKNFGCTIILGLLVGLIFNYYQLLIYYLNPLRWLLIVLDLILWVLLIGIVFGLLLWINLGEIRVYVFIALLTGIIIYYKKIAPRFNKRLSAIARMNGMLIFKGLDILVLPVRKVRVVLKSIFTKPPIPPEDEEIS